MPIHLVMSVPSACSRRSDTTRRSSSVTLVLFFYIYICYYQAVIFLKGNLPLFRGTYNHWWEFVIIQGNQRSFNRTCGHFNKTCGRLCDHSSRRFTDRCGCLMSLRLVQWLCGCFKGLGFRVASIEHQGLSTSIGTWGRTLCQIALSHPIWKP